MLSLWPTPGHTNRTLLRLLVASYKSVFLATSSLAFSILKNTSPPARDALLGVAPRGSWITSTHNGYATECRVAAAGDFCTPFTAVLAVVAVCVYRPVDRSPAIYPGHRATRRRPRSLVSIAGPPTKTACCRRRPLEGSGAVADDTFRPNLSKHHICAELPSPVLSRVSLRSRCRRRLLGLIASSQDAVDRSAGLRRFSSCLGCLTGSHRIS